MNWNLPVRTHRAEKGKWKCRGNSTGRGTVSSLSNSCPQSSPDVLVGVVQETLHFSPFFLLIFSFLFFHVFLSIPDIHHDPHAFGHKLLLHFLCHSPNLGSYECSPGPL